ncbi:isochorismatase family cysteine hydrolase [Mucilaginibacter sp. AW1-7]|uniref:isochorismatase family cysteine hydrolase n=1 Tax=Mucilaginibacter sp. AW1-7 TaxID=3349874 RepID=UPI003F737BEA
MQNNTALLVMDMQLPVVARLGNPETLLGNVANAIANARAVQIPVIYVVVGFRAGGPEISRQNKIFGATKDRLSGVNPNEMTKVHPRLTPAANELVVVKRRVSAFTGSDLEVILRAQQIQHIVLTGIDTSGVVLSTLREAADKDYRITVLADCCGDADEEVHCVLTTKVFVSQAEVMTLADWGKK